jgi:hypothetical protein
MGVCPAKLLGAAVGGAGSFCINDLPAYRSGLEVVGRQPWSNYRGATSDAVSFEKVV